MATDKFFLETLRLASGSHGFRALLRLNPGLARKADRNRDQIVLEYMQGAAIRDGLGAASYADSIARGYDPLKPKADYLLLVDPPHLIDNYNDPLVTDLGGKFLIH